MRVRLSHCTNVRRAEKVLVKIHHADGDTEVTVNEQAMPEHNQLFTTLGTYKLKPGRNGWVEISNAGDKEKYVIVDAVQFLLRN